MFQSTKSCKSCEVLKQQLEIANSEKKELLEALLSIVKPAPVIVSETTKILEPTDRKFTTFSKRRSALEEASRQKANAEKSSLAAKSDNEQQKSIESLEKELGVVDASKVG